MDDKNIRLFMDCCEDPTVGFELVESSSKGGRTRFRGKFQEADAVNKNKRSYPYQVLDENVRRLQSLISENKLLGELDHPSDSIVHLTNASHKITKLWWDDNIMMGEGETLSTPHGKVLAALLADGVVFGISSRGVGSGKLNENGILVIGENYKLITFDAVADPSTINAYQKQVSKSSESVFFPEKHALPEKNEGKCIHTVNENQLMALFQCIVESKTQDIKARVNH